MVKCLLVCLFCFPFCALAQQEDSAKVGRSSLTRDFYEGLHEKTTGNIRKAETLFKKVLSNDANNAAAMYELAGIYLINMQTADAGAMIAQAVSVEPDNKWYWLLYAELARKSDKRDMLVHIFDNLIRLDPNASDYYFDKAVTLAYLDRNKEAENVYQTIQQLFGDSEQLQQARNKLAFQKESPAEKVSFFKDQLKKEPGNISNYLDLAEQYLRGSQTREAFEVLKKAEKLAPENFLVRMMLADYYDAVEDPQKSQEEMKLAFANPALSVDIKVKIILMSLSQAKNTAGLEKPLALSRVLTEAHPRDPKAFALLGDILAQKEDRSAAIAAYRQALDLNPNVYLVWAQMLQLEASAGLYDQLISDAGKAIRCLPDEPDFYFIMALAYSSKSQYQLAADNLHRAISLEPKKMVKDAEMYSLLGSAYNSLRMYAASDTAFQKSLELNPDNALTLNNFAYFLSQRKSRLREAEQMARKANDLQPDVASLQDTYAWVLFRLNKFGDARVWIERAIKNNAQNAGQYEHYGDILYHLGLQQEAMEQWLKARDKGIKSEILKRKINEKKYLE